MQRRCGCDWLAVQLTWFGSRCTRPQESAKASTRVLELKKFVKYKGDSFGGTHVAFHGAA